MYITLYKFLNIILYITKIKEYRYQLKSMYDIISFYLFIFCMDLEDLEIDPHYLL